MSSPGLLSREVLNALTDSANELWLSPVSVWEALLLVEKGKLELRGDPEEIVSKALRVISAREAPLTHEIVIASRTIDLPHRDPADRFLAATANVLGLTLVTADRRLIASAGVETLANGRS